MAANRVIGRDNDIPWHIPGEQARFKKITMGHPMIMGRKTWDSIGGPLPGRRNIVVTRDSSFHASGVEVVHSLEKGLESCSSARKIFIIGGAQIFKLALPITDTLILTTLPEPVMGNIYFPNFSLVDFHKISSEQVNGPISYVIDTFTRSK